MSNVHLRKYGVETTIPFTLFEVDGVNFRVDAVAATADTTISINEGAATSCGNLFVDRGTGYSQALTAGEVTGARIVVYIADSATKVWLDDSYVVETYGHPLAMHAFDLDESHGSAQAAYGAITAATVAAQVTTVVGIAGSSLTAINLPNQTIDITGNITGNLSGTVGAVASVQTIVDGAWDEPLTGNTHNDATSAGRRLRQLATIFVLEEDTAQGGAASSITFAAGSNANDNFFRHTMVVITAGPGINQVRAIQTYNGTSKDAHTVPDWIVNPTSASTYQVLADTTKHVFEIETGGILAASFVAGAVNAAALGPDAITAAKIADDAFAAEHFAGSALVAATFATDSLVARALAADAVTEIQSGLATAALTATGSALTVVDGIVDAILVDTGTTLPAAHVLLATGSALTVVDGIVDTILVDTETTLPAEHALLATASAVTLVATPAQVNAQVLDVMNVDTFAEPGQGAPGATLSIFAKINYLFKAWRNKSETTATEHSIYNDAEAVKDQKATVSDDGTTYTKGEIGTGA